MHFYHLHALDWVDVVSALDADPAATADLQQCLSDWPNNTTDHFAGIKAQLTSFVETGQLGIFTNGYWGHPAYKLSPELNLMAVSHYLEALGWQRKVAKILTIFGGKNPHPNFSVGGVPCAIDTSFSGTGKMAVTMDNLDLVQSIIAEMRTFVDQVYVPDTLAIATCYKDEWGKPGHGEGLGNFLTFGDFPLDEDTFATEKLFVPRGAILGRDLTKIHPVNLDAEDEIQEFVSYAWYNYNGGKDIGLHPYQGETNPNYTGPTPPFGSLEPEFQPYSWVKAPRWKGQAMEVGPLARVLMLYASGHEATQNLVDSALIQLKLPLSALFSTLGRTAARTLESKLIADQMDVWHEQLMDNIAAGDVATHNGALWNPSTWPTTSKGAGFMEAPRGALAHWIRIGNQKIDNYQAIIPSTWNGGPKDNFGQEGAYEAALIGHTIHDPTQPVEILRTIHSFDPCLACAVHVVDPDGKELVQVKVR
jgi:hydrogenase large subunit